MGTIGVDIGQPAPTEYSPFYAGYIGQALDPDLLGALDRQMEEIRAWAASVPADKERYRYAEGKWTVREVVGHLGDGERVFGYRALCISRGDETPLPSFDENAYIAESRYDERPLKGLVDDWLAFRRANLATLRPLTREEWRRMGTASEKPVSVRALGAILLGHVRHHVAVLQEKYGL